MPRAKKTTSKKRVGRKTVRRNSSDRRKNISGNLRGSEDIFWTKPLKHESLEVYAAAIDTTFAVYNKRNDNYCGGKGKENSVRVAGNFTAIHYPWIEKDPMPKSEEDFYLENGNLKIINWHNKN